MSNGAVSGPPTAGQSPSTWRFSGTYIIGVLSLVLVVIFWVGSGFLTDVLVQGPAWRPLANLSLLLLGDFENLPQAFLHVLPNQFELHALLYLLDCGGSGTAFDESPSKRRALKKVGLYLS